MDNFNSQHSQNQRKLYSKNPTRLNKVGGNETLLPSERCLGCQPFSGTTLPCKSYCYPSQFHRSMGRRYNLITITYGQPKFCN